MSLSSRISEETVEETDISVSGRCFSEGVNMGSQKWICFPERPGKLSWRG